MDIGQIRCEGVKLIQVPQNSVQFRAWERGKNELRVRHKHKIFDHLTIIKLSRPSCTMT